MVKCELLSLFNHFKLLVFLNRVVSRSIQKFKFLINLVNLVQTDLIFKAQIFLSIRVSKLFKLFFNSKPLCFFRVKRFL